MSNFSAGNFQMRNSRLMFGSEVLGPIQNQSLDAGSLHHSWAASVLPVPISAAQSWKWYVSPASAKSFWCGMSGRV